MADVLILGGTDTTIAVAEAVLNLGLTISGIVTVGERFDISYSRSSVTSARFAPVERWCAEKSIRAIPFKGYDDLLQKVDENPPRLGLAAGWYHLVPKWFRDRLALGCLGFHASLLPRLRGGAPLNWAILEGYEETGVTLFQLADGVDDGMIYGQEHIPIGPRTRIGELVDAAASASVTLVGRYLPAIVEGRAEAFEQEGMLSYGLQRRPDDGRVDWGQSAERIDALVRAVSQPYPGAFSDLDGQKVFLWRTEPVEDDNLVSGARGQLFRLPGCEFPYVVCGAGLLRITEATDEGGSSALDWLIRSAQRRFAT